jgi:transposase InsO family protein
VALPPRSPNLHAYAERWVRSGKDEALSRLMLFGEPSLRHALQEYVTYFHHERPHQGMGNVVLIPWSEQRSVRGGSLRCQERLGGLLKYYDREAA